MYAKVIEDGYIVSFGTGIEGVEITESEYNQIMYVFNNRPHAEDKGYKMKADLTWEEYNLEPIEDDEELTDDEAFAILTGGEL